MEFVDRRQRAGVDVTTEKISVSVATDAVRSVLKNAGEEGISVRDFFNHDTLAEYSHTQIDEALRTEMSTMSVTLGEVASRYSWIDLVD